MGQMHCLSTRFTWAESEYERCWEEQFCRGNDYTQRFRFWESDSKTYILPMWILFIIHLVFDLIRVNEIVECLKLSIIWRIQLNILMTNNMKISLIKLKIAHYYQLSLWILTHVSNVKKRHLKGTESCKKWNHAIA